MTPWSTALRSPWIFWISLMPSRTTRGERSGVRGDSPGERGSKRPGRLGGLSACWPSVARYRCPFKCAGGESLCISGAGRPAAAMQRKRHFYSYFIRPAGNALSSSSKRLASIFMSTAKYMPLFGSNSYTSSDDHSATWRSSIKSFSRSPRGYPQRLPVQRSNQSVDGPTPCLMDLRNLVPLPRS